MKTIFFKSYIHVTLYNRVKGILNKGTSNRQIYKFYQWDKNRNLIHKLKL